MADQMVITAPVTRIVPKGEVSDDDLAVLANKMNWLLARMIPGDAQTPEEFIVCTADRRTFVHWIKDPKINLVYLAVLGAEQDEIASVVRAEFASYSIEEAAQQARAAKGRVGRMRAIYHLALLAPVEFDEGLFAIFGDYAGDSDAEVRGAAVLAMSYAGWPRFVDLLRPLSAGDPDDSVRRDAETLMENMKKYPARSMVAR